MAFPFWERSGWGLQIIPWISSGCLHVSFYIHPKGKDHVNDDRRAHCEERNIDEPHADAACGNA